jgi:CheY-like chemotaxis protein
MLTFSRALFCPAPIISMTSNSSPEDLLAYMSSGMNGHLYAHKPVSYLTSSHETDPPRFCFESS